LKDIGKEVGNAGMDISKGAISLIRQPTALADRMRIGNNLFFSKDDGKIKNLKQEPKLIEMDPCEFELSSENQNQLEFDDSEMDSNRGATTTIQSSKKKISSDENHVEEDVIVGAVSMIHHSNGRYHMTLSDDSQDDKAGMTPNHKKALILPPLLTPHSNNSTQIVLDDYSNHITTSPTYFNDDPSPLKPSNSLNHNHITLMESHQKKHNQRLDIQDGKDDNEEEDIASISSEDDQDCCV